MERGATSQNIIRDPFSYILSRNHLEHAVSPPPMEPARQPTPGGLAAQASALARGGRYLDVLNPEQRAAVEALEGPVLVLAGAGTGKTRVLTTRIAHILSLGHARAWEILAVTFTNKASREMRERVETLVGPGAEAMQWLGTFHAISAKILRRHAELVGLKSNFTILDTDDQIRLLKQVLKAENVDDKRWPARALAARIDGWKNRGLTAAQVPAGDAQGFADGKGAALYALYQERLKILNAVDFGDLLLEALRLFRDNPDVLAEYQRRFKYILVDEYQDTNTAQYLWLRLIAQGRRNVCCVGDDDQSVYGWRGAEVENILRFEKDFPGAKVIRLERNYRSTGHILAAASHLIAHNEGRLGKTLFTDGGDGEKPSVTGVWDSEEEARAVGEEIEQLQRRGHVSTRSPFWCAPRSRCANSKSASSRSACPIASSAARVSTNAPKFATRSPICAASRSPPTISPSSASSTCPSAGSATPRCNCCMNGAARNIPIMQAARTLVESEEIKAKPRATLRALLARFRALALADRRQAAARTRRNGFGRVRLYGNVATGQNAGGGGPAGKPQGTRARHGAVPDLAGFLEHVSLVMETDEAAGARRVSIMTLHGAKGLEFETVFLPGWEEGLFPHQRSLDENGRAGLEEERRLAYVGVTRAKRRARIYFATNRRIHGLWQTTSPSRFIDNLPAAHVEVVE